MTFIERMKENKYYMKKAKRFVPDYSGDLISGCVLVTNFCCLVSECAGRSEKKETSKNDDHRLSFICKKSVDEKLFTPYIHERFSQICQAQTVVAVSCGDFTTS